MTRKLRFVIGAYNADLFKPLSVHLAYSHDAFYPHHREDLRKDEMRLDCAIHYKPGLSLCWAQFFIWCYAMKAERVSGHMNRNRIVLSGAANEAAHVGRATLLEGGTAEATILAVLAAYAKRLEFVWNSRFCTGGWERHPMSDWRRCGRC